MFFFKNTLFAKLSVTCRQITGSSLELAASFMLEWLNDAYLVESCFKLHREEALASVLEEEKVFLLYFKMSSWRWYLFRHVGDSVQTRSGYTMQSKTTHKHSGDKRCSSSASSFQTYFETRSIQIHLDCLQTVLDSVPVHPVWPPSSCFSLPSIWLNM